MSDPTKEPLRRRTRVLLVLGLLAAIALSAAALFAWREHVEAMKPRVLEHRDVVVGLSFAPRGDRLFTVSGVSHAILTCWTEPDGRSLGETNFEEFSPTDLRVSSRGDLAGIAFAVGDLALLALPGATPLGEALSGGDFEVGTPPFESCAVRFSPSGERVAINGVSGRLRVWSVRDRAHVVPLDEDAQPSSRGSVHDCSCVLGFLSEDQIAFVGSGAIKVWSVSKKAVEKESPNESSGTTCDFASPRATLWIACPWSLEARAKGTPFTTRVRRLPAGEPVGPPVMGRVGAAIAFSDDDALIVIASPEGVTVQEVATGTTVFTHAIEGEKGYFVTAAAFSPIADRVAVAFGKRVFVFPFRR